MPSHALSTPLSASVSTVTPKRFAPLQRLLALLTIVMAVAALGACTAPRGGTKGLQIANIARAQVGKPYAWGATGPNAFDCSGLAQFSYGRAGVGIPRTTGAQLGAARYVPQSAAQPGDLIFFGNYHVGVYVGGGQMVDAPGDGRSVLLRAPWTGSYSVGRLY